MGSVTYSLAGFARFCSLLVLENGKTMRLEQYEKTCLRDYFAGALESVVLIPKKNGKSTLLGALALYHLEVTPEAECVIGAASRDQATLIYNQAAGLVRRSDLGDRYDVRAGYRLIRHRRHAGRIRVLASDPKTADGIIPTLALVDELHRHPSGELYDVFRDGLGPRDGQMVTISTAGATLASPLGALRTKAHQLPKFKRDEAKRYNYAASADRSFAFHEWCLSENDDPNDLKTVKIVNPASWQTIAKLRMRKESPSMTQWSWLRFACGVWTEGEEPWLDPAKWDRCASDELDMPEVQRTMGVRVAPGHRSAAIVIVGRDGDGPVVCEEHLLDLSRSDVPLVEVEERVRDLWDEAKPSVLVYTGDTFRRSADMLEADGITVLETPYTPRRMQPISESLLSLIEAGQLLHDGDPDFRASVMAARVRQTERGWQFAEAPDASVPISALLALAIAVDALGEATEVEIGFAFT